MKEPILYKILRPVITVLFKGIYRPTIIGKENVDFTDTEPNYGNKTAELAIDISSSAVCIITDTKSIMTFVIKGTSGILTDPSDSLKSTIEKNVLYINYEGS